jgi:hypothetical protein
MPAETQRRLGLDDQRSWIVVGEANVLVWPGRISDEPCNVRLRFAAGQFVSRSAHPIFARGCGPEAQSLSEQNN